MKTLLRVAALCACAMSTPVHAETIYGGSNGSWILESNLGAPGSPGDFSNNDLRIFTFDQGAEAANLTEFQIAGNTIYGLASGNHILQSSLGAPGDVIDFSTNDMRIFTFDQGAQAANLNAFQISEEAPSAVPEPAAWSLMIAGFALAGAAIRRRHAAPSWT